MTINVALVTSEAVVVGCDSVASSTELVLHPQKFIEKNAEGNFAYGEDGTMVARFKFDDLRHVVTDAWGGVTKMFPLCKENSPCAAVTAGLANLSGRNVASIASQFLRTAPPGGAYATIEAIVTAFVAHVGEQYDAHYAAVGDPPEFRTDIEFLIGGFGADDNFPSLYRVNLVRSEADRITKVYGTGQGFGSRSGVAWAGQADGIERLLFGYDRPLRGIIEGVIAKEIDTMHREMSQAVVQILADTLAALRAQLPEGVKTELPPKPELALEWDQLKVDIDFGNLPLQDAVDLVAYLVNVQSGKSKFIRGVPTVGGRTHIGIVDRHGFRMLNEPDLLHRNIGHARDL